LLGEPSQDYAERFATASAGYDTLLWNGEYYSFGAGDGCWPPSCSASGGRHQLGLGLPVAASACPVGVDRWSDTTRGTASSGSRTGRVFADGDDAGLLGLHVAEAPAGRPDPVRRRGVDRVEYQVAAHCFHEGMTGRGCGC